MTTIYKIETGEYLVSVDPLELTTDPLLALQVHELETDGILDELNPEGEVIFAVGNPGQTQGPPTGGGGAEPPPGGGTQHPPR